MTTAQPLRLEEHPVWCSARTVHEIGATLTEPCEAEMQHAGRMYTLDAGDTAAWSFILQNLQPWEDFNGQRIDHGPRVSVTIVEHELVALPVTGHLTRDEALRLAELLRIAANDLRFT